MTIPILYVSSLQENGIPRIILSIDNSIYEGQLGSYCWNSICVTKAVPRFGDFETDKKIQLPENKTIKFSLKNFANPESFHTTVYSKDNNIVLDTDIKNQLDLKLPKGVYIVNVMATWMYKGDVSYIFLIDVI
jgi:hypothetical protein